MKRALLAALQQARAEKRPALLVTDTGSGEQCLLADGQEEGDLQLSAPLREAAAAALRDDRSGLFEDRWFLQVFNPPLRLILVGAVHIAQSLAPMARLAGYEVILVDPRQAWATEERFPGLTRIETWPDEAMEALKPDRRTAVVTLTHDPKLDDPALLAAIRSPAFYIGALGSTRTHAKRLERLAGEGATAEELARIHGPVGLAIGAKSPAEIALSVLAQITQCLRGAPPLVKKAAG
jgi:xanthine dehydrogenase accessory factor